MTKDFESILAKIDTGVSGFAAAAPAISNFGMDHVGSLQQIVTVAGATTAAELTDPTQQAETIAATQTAAVLIPFLFGLFHKKVMPAGAAAAAKAVGQ